MPNGPSSKKRKAPEPLAGVERGSGNVFADVGIANPELALAKAELVRRIRHLLAAQKLTPVQAAALLGLDRPKAAALLRGRVEGYTLDRLFQFLAALGQRVEISVMPCAWPTECRLVVVA